MFEKKQPWTVPLKDAGDCERGAVIDRLNEVMEDFSALVEQRCKGCNLPGGGNNQQMAELPWNETLPCEQTDRERSCCSEHHSLTYEHAHHFKLCDRLMCNHCYRTGDVARLKRGHFYALQLPGSRAGQLVAHRYIATDSRGVHCWELLNDNKLTGDLMWYPMGMLLAIKEMNEAEMQELMRKMRSDLVVPDSKIVRPEVV